MREMESISLSITNPIMNGKNRRTTRLTGASAPMYSIVSNQTSPNIAYNPGSPESIDRSQLSVYQQGWWNDIISKTHGYREINVFLDNKVVGTLAYIISKPSDDRPLGFELSGFNLRVLPWTHLTGPILASGLNKNEQKAVAAELIRRVPRSISARFVYDVDDPYAELYGEICKNAGFSITIEPNFREPPDAPDVLTRMNREKRKKINAAKNCLNVVDMTPELFTKFYADNIKAHNKVLYEDLDIAQRLLFEGFKRKQVRILATQSKTDDTFHAALAIAEDRKRAFGWMLSYAPNSHYGATRLLFTEAIKYAKTKDLIYDADGAPSEGHIRNYKEILSIPNQVDRFVMTRFSYAHKAIYKGREVLPPVVKEPLKKCVSLYRSLRPILFPQGKSYENPRSGV
jgi:hypothetical protein